ncbi:MAG: hypothetical protein RLZ98_3378 [Pseudomonadota bacterium]|jgi:hypothetical protein
MNRLTAIAHAMTKAARTSRAEQEIVRIAEAMHRERLENIADQLGADRQIALSGLNVESDAPSQAPSPLKPTA